MITASLVIGSDGSTTLNGSSRGLSSGLDRSTFLARRRLSDCILIGGRTASQEGYAQSPVPLIILSHSRPSILDVNPLAHWWAISPVDALRKAKEEFGENVAIEGGIHFILPLVEIGAIEMLQLTVCGPVSITTQGENKVELKDLLRHFERVVETVGDEVTTFYDCSSPRKLST